MQKQEILNLMSYAILHMEKYKASDIKGIEIHNKREKESLSNPDINTELTEKNIYLKRSNSYTQDIKKNIDDLNLKKAVRKDAVLMCSFVITSDNDFFNEAPEGTEEKYFKSAYDFIAERYGEKNIINAVIHQDEKTPHLHIDITPIIDGRLSAKDLFNKTELTNLQTDFAELVGAEIGLKRGENLEIKRKHLKIQEFKIKTKEKELAEREKNLEKKANSLDILDKKAKEFDKIQEKGISTNDLEPRAKKKTLGITTERESKQDIVFRINNEKIYPAERVKEQAERVQQDHQYRKKALESFYKKHEILQGLSEKHTELIHNFAKKVHLEIQKEQKQARERKREIEKNKNIERER